VRTERSALATQNTRSGAGNDATLVPQVADHIGGDARLYSSRGLITQGNLSVMILQVPVAWPVWTASAAAGTSGGLPVRRPGRGLRRCLAVGRAGRRGD